MRMFNAAQRKRSAWSWVDSFHLPHKKVLPFSALRFHGGGGDELKGYRCLQQGYGNTQVVVPQLLGSWSLLMLFCFNVLFSVNFYFENC